MELYARQLAWLNSPIDPKDNKSRSRLELRKEKDVPLGLPVVEAEHLLQVLQSVRFSHAAGMGVAPVSALELMAWCQGMQHPLDPWEFEAVRAASAAYCGQLGSDDPREPNFTPDETKPLSPIRAMAEALNKSKKDAK